MGFDPGALDLGSLFRDPDMFDSRGSWRRAGFEVFDRSSESKIMVAAHASAPGMLFKKYVNDVDGDKQGDNYRRRVEGARRVRTLAAERGLHRVTAPHKWIGRLPRDAGFDKDDCVLVVEHLPLLDVEASKSAYESGVDDELLDQLVAVLAEFRGLDSAVMNMPLTVDGRIAFIDTEHWDRRSKSKKFLDHLKSYLPKDSYKRAKKTYKRLRGDDED